VTPKSWKFPVRKKFGRSNGAILRVVGMILALAGGACGVAFAFTSNRDFAWLGLSSFASAFTGLLIARHVEK
jgi:hypothetical protein